MNIQSLRETHANSGTSDFVLPLRHDRGFDYIILGAGSAGCVLAHRLSEDTACLGVPVEAGGEPDPGHWWHKHSQLHGLNPWQYR